METVEPWLGNCFFGLCQALEGSTDDRSLPVTLELKETTFLPAPCFMVFHDLVPAPPYLLQDGSYPEKPLESELFQGSRYPKAIYKPVLYIRPSKKVGCLDSAPCNIFTISSSFSFFNWNFENVLKDGDGVKWQERDGPEAGAQGKRMGRVGSKKGEESTWELAKPNRRTNSSKCQGREEDIQIPCCGVSDRRVPHYYNYLQPLLAGKNCLAVPFIPKHSSLIIPLIRLVPSLLWEACFSSSNSISFIRDFTMCDTVCTQQVQQGFILIIMYYQEVQCVCAGGRKGEEGVLSILFLCHVSQL